ncbi:MAG: M15 family metallopeptidase [Clostridia bacterium]|nr:M15 family metallopeptidase [Clostridia bacterium]
MKRGYTVRVLCVLLICATLFVGAGWIFYHGEWWFPMIEQLRIYDENPWKKANDFDGEEQTLSSLKATSCVTYSNIKMLINAEHPLPEDYEPSLVTYNGAQMHPFMLQSYIALRDDVEEQTGVRIYVVSDYRTSEEQEQILHESADGIAAPLGCSEHEAGLALDVYAPYHDGKTFLRSDAGRLINRICGEYGFILRYPVGKEEITGISYEPWHLRYVGAPHAKMIMDCGLTYEEYIESFVPNTWYSCENYYTGRFDSKTIPMPSGWKSCEISPDNTGYYLITVTM